LTRTDSTTGPSCRGLAKVLRFFVRNRFRSIEKSFDPKSLGNWQN
jgi:hypothetical protein